MPSSKSPAVKKPVAKKKAAKFVPAFEGGIEGWVVNGMRANYFRVERTMSRDDYMQEAYLLFLALKQRYMDTVTEPAHFMALFKTSWTNQLNDMSTADTRTRSMFVSSSAARDEDGEEIMIDSVGELSHDGDLAILLRQAPREVTMVLFLFLNAPQEIVEKALASWNGGDKRYATTHGGSRRINQMLGLDPNVDVMRKVHDYFSPAPR